MRYCFLRYGWFQALLGVLLLMAAELIGQPIETGFYSSDNGLTDRTVEDILIGPDGFLWVATTNSLHRFDGYNFLAFNDRADRRVTQRLAASNISSLHLSSDKRIVIFYHQKNHVFDVLDPLTHEIERVDLGLKGLKGRPLHLSVDKKGRIFAVTQDDNHIHILEYRQGEFVRQFSLADRLQHPFQLLHLSDGRFLTHSANRGFQVYDAGGKRLYALQDTSAAALSPGLAGRQPSLDIMYEQSAGMIWLSYANRPGIMSWNGEGRYCSRRTDLSQTEHYTDLWPDKSGNVMLNQADPVGNYPFSRQLYMINGRGKLVPFSQLLPLTSGFVLAAAGHDFSRLIFLGLDTGLKTIRNTYSNIRNYLREEITIDQRGKVMRGMTADGAGNLYFARERECWYRLDPRRERLDTLYLTDEATGRRINFNCCNQLYYDAGSGYIWAITCENNTTGRGQLLRYNPATGKAACFFYEHRFTCMTVDRTGRFWLGVNQGEEGGGLVYFDPRRDTAFHAFVSGGSNPFRGALPRYLLESKGGAIWVGADLGLFRIWPGGRYEVYRRDLNEINSDEHERPLSLSDNVIYVLHETPTGQLFIGTKNGLDIFDPKSGKITATYNEREGLASNTVCGILPDNAGNYWISTFNGISYFDVGKQSFMRFYQSDGFTHSEFNRYSFFRDRDGRFYFGGVNGVNSFYTADLLRDQGQPRLTLTSLTRYNSWSDSLLMETALHSLDELVLSPFDEYFDLTFSLLDYTQPSRNRYRYQLVGVDKSWVQLTEQHSLRYHGLSPGRYTLRIQGAGPNGSWNSNVLEVVIHAKQVFYKQVWFFMLLSIVAILFFYGLFRERLNQRLSEERLRTQLSSDLHDEVSGLLAGIAMQADLLHGNTNDGMLQQKLQRISEASRRAMSKMSDVIWSIDSRRDRVGDLIARMEEHADEVLLPLGVLYEIQVEKLEKQQTLPANVRQDLYFIFKEAVNNIAKHAKASRAQIMIRNMPQFFELKIQDNGIGAQGVRTSGRTGQGLSNLHMRAQRLGADLQIEAEEGFTVRLRMKRFL